MNFASPPLLDGPSAGLGIAVASVTAMNLWLRPRHAVAISWLLCGMWAYSKAAAFVWGWDTARLLYPAADVLALSTGLFLWWIRPAQWKLGIVYAYLTKLVIHVLFWSQGQSTPHTHDQIYNYALAQNIMYGLAVMFASLPGGGVIASAVGSWLSLPWPGARRAHAQSGRQASRSEASK